MKGKRRQVSVGVISKVLRILEFIDGAPSGLNLKLLCEQTGINKSTAHRFLVHLEREGYLFRADGRTYLIGPKLSKMGTRSAHTVTLQAVCRPFLRELWKATRESINLAILDETKVVYLEVLESPHDFRLVSKVGMHRPIYSTALGKALAAFLTDEDRDEVLNFLNFQALTPRTIITLAQLRKELEVVRQQGYALDDEESLLGARCVGAPILDSNRVAVAAVSVSGPTTRLNQDKIFMIAEAVMEATRAISASLGFSTPRKDERPEVHRHLTHPVT